MPKVMTAATRRGARGESVSRSALRIPIAAETDGALFALLERWRAAECVCNRIGEEYERRESERERVPWPAELSPRPGDLKLFGRGLANSGAFDEKWIDMMAPLADRARGLPRPFSLGCAERFDEIRRAYSEWSVAEEASRAAAGLPELLRTRDDARRNAADLRRRVAATAARTVEGVLAKLAALARVQGAEVIDDEMVMAMAGPIVDIDAVFFSVARDCDQLAARGEIVRSLAV